MYELAYFLISLNRCIEQYTYHYVITFFKINFKDKFLKMVSILNHTTI